MKLGFLNLCLNLRLGNGRWCRYEIENESENSMYMHEATGAVGLMEMKWVLVDAFEIRIWWLYGTHV